MTTEELDELLFINEARAGAGDRTAATVVRLVWSYLDLLQADHASACREAMMTDLIRGLVKRVEAQSELLSKRAEK